MTDEPKSLEGGAEPQQQKNQTPDTVPYSRFNEVIEQKNHLTEELKKRDEQLKGLAELQKKADSVDEFKSKIEELQEANKLAAKEHEDAMLTLKKDNLLTQALTKEGAKNIKLTKHAFKEYMESAKLDDSGNLVGLDEKVKEIKTSEDYSFCFEVSAPQNPLEQAGLLQSSKPGDGLSPTDPAPIDPTKPMSYSDFEKVYEAQNSPNTG